MNLSIPCSQTGWKHRLLLAISLALACFSFGPLASAESPASEADDFDANLRRIFAGDGTADVRVIFGYDNSYEMKNPSDPGRSARFMKALTARGFQPMAVTPELAEQLDVPVDAPNLRLMEGLGSGGQHIRVSLMWSAASLSTAYNIGVGAPEQFRRSLEAQKFMRRAASSSEVMIYIGHSRGGGGPDTFPPQIKVGREVKSQTVDFSYYRANTPGLDSLEPSFTRSPATPYFIVWTGCKSHPLFSPWFSNILGKKDHPTCLVLSTRLIWFLPQEEAIGQDECLMAGLNMMDALLWRPSRASFELRLKDCEIEEKRNPEKQAWKLTIVPGERAVPKALQVSEVPGIASRESADRVLSSNGNGDGGSGASGG